MRQIFSLFILAAILGCTGYDSKENDTPDAGNDTIISMKGYDVIELHKMKTGHVTVTINVNGKPCLFLVDTGGGGTLVDISKKEKYGLEASGNRDYAAGIGSVSPLVKTSAIMQIGGKKFQPGDLFLMDISYINSEFKKTKGRQVDGVLGTDFLERHKAVIDYPHSKIYLIIEPEK